MEEEETPLALRHCSSRGPTSLPLGIPCTDFERGTKRGTGRKEGTEEC